MLTNIINSLEVLSKKADKLIVDITSSCKNDTCQKYLIEAHRIAYCESIDELQKNKQDLENVKLKDTSSNLDISEPSRVHLHSKNGMSEKEMKNEPLKGKQVKHSDDFLSNENSNSKPDENDDSVVEASRSKSWESKFGPETENFESKRSSTGNFFTISRVRSVSSLTVSSKENASSHSNCNSPNSNSKYVLHEYQNINFKHEIGKKTEDFYSVKTVSVSSITSVFHASNFKNSNTEYPNSQNRNECDEQHPNNNKSTNVPYEENDSGQLKSNVISSSVEEQFSVSGCTNGTKESGSSRSIDNNFKFDSAVPHPIRLENVRSLNANGITIVNADDSGSHAFNQSDKYLGETFHTGNNHNNSSWNLTKGNKETIELNSTQTSETLKPPISLISSEISVDITNLQNNCIAFKNIKSETCDDDFENNRNLTSNPVASQNFLFPNEFFSIEEAKNLRDTKNLANKNASSLEQLHGKDSEREPDFLMSRNNSDGFQTPSTRVSPDVIPLIPRRGKVSKSDFYKLWSAEKEVLEKKRTKNKSSKIAKRLKILTEATNGKAPVSEPVQYSSSSPEKTTSVSDLVPKDTSSADQVPRNTERLMDLTETATFLNTELVWGSKSSTSVSLNPTHCGKNLDRNLCSELTLTGSNSQINPEYCSNSNREVSINTQSCNLRPNGKNRTKYRSLTKPYVRRAPRINRSFRDRTSLVRHCISCDIPLCSGFFNKAKKDESETRVSSSELKGLGEKTKVRQDRIKQTRERKEKLEKERGEKNRHSEEKRRKRLQKHEERSKKKIDNAKMKARVEKPNNRNAGCDVTWNEPSKMDCTFLVASKSQGVDSSSDSNPISCLTDDNLDRRTFPRKNDALLTGNMEELSKQPKVPHFVFETSSSREASSRSNTSKHDEKENIKNRSSKYHFGKINRLNNNGTIKRSKSMKLRINNENSSNFQTPSKHTSVETANSMTYVKNKVTRVNRYLKTPSIHKERSLSNLRGKASHEAREFGESAVRTQVSCMPSRSDSKLLMRTSVVLDDVLNQSGEISLVASELSNQLRTPMNQLGTQHNHLGSPKTQLKILKNELEAPKNQLGTPKNQLETPKHQLETPKNQPPFNNEFLVDPKLSVLKPRVVLADVVNSSEKPRTSASQTKKPNHLRTLTNQLETPKNRLRTPKTHLGTPKTHQGTPKLHLGISKLHLETPKNQVRTPKNHSPFHIEFLVDPKLSVLKPRVVLADVANSTEKPRTPTSQTKKLKPSLSKTKSKKKSKRKKSCHKSPEITSYVMSDLDDMDDDCLVRASVDQRKVPQWAKGILFKHALLKQCYEPTYVDKIFGNLEHYKTIDLEDVFNTSKPRYHTRSSSANWSCSNTPV